MLNIMITTAKLTAKAVLIAGGALVGLLGGWNLGPLTLDVSREQLGWLGAGGGLLLAALGCHFASEWAEARDQRRTQAVVLQRLLRITGS